MRDVVDRLDALGIHASSASSVAMENFIRVGIENMGPIYDIYKKYCLPYPDPCRFVVLLKIYGDFYFAVAQKHLY